MSMHKIFAHRGYSGKYPENTPVAFQRAADFPIDGIELDVHLSRDGQVVICHDESIDRTSNGSGLIRDYDWDQLREFDFSAGMSGFSREEVRIWSLTDFFDCFVGREDLLVNIELKTNLFRYPGIEEKVADLVDAYGMASRVIVSSFNHHSVRRMQALLPQVSTAFLTADVLLDPGDYCSRYEVDHYHPDYQMVDPEDVADCHRHNVQVNAYTINEEEAMRQAMANGVDGIITNEVELALAVVSSQPLDKTS